MAIIDEVAKESLLLEIEKNGLDKITAAMIMAQCEHESLGFSRLEESFNYTTVKRLLEVFGTYFKTVQQAKTAIAGGPEYIANVVYANRMGNGEKNTGDGYRYRGRGLIMITGRSNYQEVSAALKIDILLNPDLAKQPHEAALIAVNFFTRKPWLMKACKKGDVLQASSWINLGYYKEGQKQLPLGLPERKENFEAWLKKLA